MGQLTKLPIFCRNTLYHKVIENTSITKSILFHFRNTDNNCMYIMKEKKTYVVSITD